MMLTGDIFSLLVISITVFFHAFMWSLRGELAAVVTNGLTCALNFFVIFAYCDVTTNFQSRVCHVSKKKII